MTTMEAKAKIQIEIAERRKADGEIRDSINSCLTDELINKWTEYDTLHQNAKLTYNPDEIYKMMVAGYFKQAVREVEKERKIVMKICKEKFPLIKQPGIWIDRLHWERYRA